MKGRAGRLYKKLHRWPGLIIAFILLYFAITGIIMNHRDWLAGIDVKRTALPSEYHYRNWNNGALKGNLVVSADSILVYGNIGIWVTDSSFTAYRPFNQGIPGGSDNRKTFDLHRTPDGNLYAATQFGLYSYHPGSARWEPFDLDVRIKRFVALENMGDTIYAMNRSYIFSGISEGPGTVFRKHELAPPAGYTGKITLFETVWQIHSGEIFGIPGKLFVDLMGLITIFLSATGIIYFFFPGWIRKRKRKRKETARIRAMNKWSLKWHNHLGAWTFVVLILLYFTGMFLRPPLLITIAEARVKPVRYSHLDQPNPWHDKLRDMVYDQSGKKLLLSTSEGMFHMGNPDFSPVSFRIQPPVSVMGINALEPHVKGSYLVGSFSGLYLWHPEHPAIFNYLTGARYHGEPSGRPVGDFKVTGMITGTAGDKYVIDYDQGIFPLNHDKPFPPMPAEILEECGMSLWNFALEIHTGRIFSALVGDFYILIVPLAGLTGITVVISGYLLWRKKYRRSRPAEK